MKMRIYEDSKVRLRQFIDKENPRYTVQFYRYGYFGRHDILSPVIPLRLHPSYRDLRKLATACHLGEFSDAVITGQTKDHKVQLGAFTNRAGNIPTNTVRFEVRRLSDDIPMIEELIR